MECPNKLLPLAIVGWLGASIIACPCETLLSCKKESSIVAILGLLGLVIMKYPTPRVTV